MKVLVLTLLLVLVCSTQVLSLTCNTCESEDDRICKTETLCSDEAQYCKTYEKQGEIISRTCEEFCSEDVFTTCCQTDNC